MKNTILLGHRACQACPVTDQDLQPVLQEYYRLRGWSETGTPTEAKLTELGVADVARHLMGQGDGR